MSDSDQISSLSAQVSSLSSIVASLSSSLATATAEEVTSTSDVYSPKLIVSKMSMSSSSSNSCKISMLWNWYTIDSCFISRKWHITSKSMMIGSCFGVIFFVMALEGFKRLQREWDRYIHRSSINKDAVGESPVEGSSEEAIDNTKSGNIVKSIGIFRKPQSGNGPAFWKHIVSSFMFAIQFGAAYLVMLLAMYYNGYIIICLILGALFGYMVFGYDLVSDSRFKNQPATCCCA